MGDPEILTEIKFVGGRTVTGLVSSEEMEKIKDLLLKKSAMIEVNLFNLGHGYQVIILPREQCESIDFITSFK